MASFFILITGDPYLSEVLKPVEENQEPPEGWPRNPVFNAPGDVPGPPVQFGPPVEPTTVKAGEGFTGIGLPENDIFYFHPDHLGSTSYISTKNGSISQHVEYIAFGEVLFEEHSSSFSSPYLFNGKELDRETNLFYFGARYYDAKSSLWLTLDMMAEKGANISGYVYCFNNPLMFSDPSGLWPVYNENGEYIGDDGRSEKGKDLAFTGEKDGKGGFKNLKQLSMSNSDLNKYANTVAEESSGNKKESFAIASTIKNLAKSKNQTIEKTLTKGIFGYDNGGNDPTYKDNSEYSMGAVINALNGGQDYSNGATKWDGIDFLAWGLKSPNGTPHNKFEEYSYIEIEASIYSNYKNSITKGGLNKSIRYGTKSYDLPAEVFENIKNWKIPTSLALPWCGFQYSTGAKKGGGKTLDATASYGKTIFWQVIK